MYNCEDYAKDYIKKVSQVGYSAKIKVVTIDCPENWNKKEKMKYCSKGKVLHALVQLTVFIDPTIGIFIEPKHYKLWGI